MRCPARPSYRTIPLRRCLPARDPRVRDLVDWRRPCGFTPDGCDAVVLDVRTGRLLFAGSIRRVAAAAKHAARKSTHLPITACGRSSAKPIHRAHQRSVTSSATASLNLRANDAWGEGLWPFGPFGSVAQAGSCTDAFLGAVYRYHAARAFTAWLDASRSFPRKPRSSGAPGVLDPSQYCSRMRVTRCLQRLGPTPFASTDPPD